MAGATGHRVPNSLVTFLLPFRDAFTAPTWEHVLVLVMGAILVPGRRTVASALRVMGLGQARQFTNYHRVLNRNAWSAHALSRRLLVRLVDAFVPAGEPVVIAPDDSIERRWGARIKKRGIYRDPVRSSKGHFVKASGLRWLSFALLPEIRWAGRCWALPFLAILAPSQRYWETHRAGQRPFKTLTDWARQGLLQTAHRRRRRCQLRCYRTACGRAAPGHHDHPPAARRGAPRSAAGSPSPPPGAVAPGRGSPAHAPATRGQPADTMAPPAGERMVRPRRKDTRGGLRHRPLGQARSPRPHPLRPGPCPDG